MISGQVRNSHYHSAQTRSCPLFVTSVLQNFERTLVFLNFLFEFFRISPWPTTPNISVTISADTCINRRFLSVIFLRPGKGATALYFYFAIEASKTKLESKTNYSQTFMKLEQVMIFS